MCIRKAHRAACFVLQRRGGTARTFGDLLEPDVPVGITVDNSRKTNVVTLKAAIVALDPEKGPDLAKAD